MSEQDQQTVLKSAKDSLVSALFELSKSAQEAATATINFYNIASNDKTGDSFKSLLSSLSAIQGVTNAISNPAEVKSEGPVKRKRAKVEKDPNAPKKPLTVFFAYSAHVREKLREERRLKNLPSLSSTELTLEISKKWNELPAEEINKWKQKYHDEVLVYQKKRDDYLATKDVSNINPEILQLVSPIETAPPAIQPVETVKALTKKRKVDEPKESKGESKKIDSNHDEEKKREKKKEKKSKKRKSLAAGDSA